MYGKARTGAVCGSYRASFYHGAKIRNSAVLPLAGNLLGSAFPKPCFAVYILVREYRYSGGTETASPVEGNR